MTIIASFVAAGVLMYFAAKLGVFHHIAVDEETAWQGTLDEALEAAVTAAYDRDFDAIVAADARRNHPSTGGQ